MTTGTYDYSSNGRSMSAGPRSPSFAHASGFGAKGYDEHDVDAWVNLTNAQIDDLNRRIAQLESDKADLAGRVRGEDDIIQQSVSILTTAQQTADATVKNADDYSGRVLADARRQYDESTRQARQLLSDAERQATEAAAKSAAEKADVERQTLYLQTLLETVKVNMVTSLEGMLRYVGAEFGKSATRAADAATRNPWEQ